MAFNNFPYTDFHELNLDWILKKIKTWAREYETILNDYDNLNKLYLELSKKIDEEIGGEAAEAAKEQLQEWLDDGTLANLLNTVTTDAVGTFNLQRLFRTVELTDQYVDASYDAKWPQGGCLTRNGTWIQAYSTRNDKDVLFEEYDLNNDYIVTRTGGPVDLGHANSITYDGNYIWVAERLYNNNTTSKIVKLNYNNFSVVEEYTNPSYFPVSISFDPISNKTYFIDYYWGHYANVYEFIPSTGNGTYTGVFVCALEDGENYRNHLQEIKVYDSMIYSIGADDETFTSYTMDGNIHNAYVINDVQGIYRVGEKESFDILGSNVLFSSIVTTGFGNARITQFWRGNLKYGVAVDSVGSASNRSPKIYVDASSGSNNPDGYSENEYFRYIQEAIITGSILGTTSFEIVNGSYEETFAMYNMHATFDFKNSTLDGQIINSFGTVSIKDLTVDCNNTEDGYNTAIYNYYGTMTLDTVTIDAGGKYYGIANEKGILSLLGTTTVTNEVYNDVANYGPIPIYYDDYNNPISIWHSVPSAGMAVELGITVDSSHLSYSMPAWITQHLHYDKYRFVEVGGYVSGNSYSVKFRISSGIHNDIDGSGHQFIWTVMANNATTDQIPWAVRFDVTLTKDALTAVAPRIFYVNDGSDTTGTWSVNWIRFSN